MAHYALINKNNIVVQVITGRDENELKIDWEQYYSEKTGFIVKRTSYNTMAGIYYDPETQKPSDNQKKAFRKNYANIGDFFDAEKDAFYTPQPFKSWLLNEQTCQWLPPVDHPTDGKKYEWDETTVNWKLVETEAE